MTRTIIPNPLENDKEFDRYNHYDLPDAELSDLQDELWAIRPLLWWQIDGMEWLRERASQLQTEITRRKYSDHEIPQDKPMARPRRLAGGVKL